MRIIWQVLWAEIIDKINEIRRGPREKGRKNNAPLIDSVFAINARTPATTIVTVVRKAGDLVPFFMMLFRANNPNSKQNKAFLSTPLYPITVR